MTTPAADAATVALPPRFDPARRRRVAVALVMVTAVASFEATVVSTAMPTIIAELHGLGTYSWVFSVYLLAATVSMPLYGRLADVHGRRRLLLLAIGLFLAGAVCCSLAGSMGQLIAARALQGLGAGGLLPIAMTVSGDLYTLRERARIQGVFSGVWGVASLVGPMLGAALTLSFGWRSVFWITIPFGVPAALLVFTQMIESRARRPDPVDLAGAATLTVGVTLLLLSCLQRAGAGVGAAWRLAALVAGLGALGVFARQQSRREHPLVPPWLFGRRDTLAPYLGGVLLGTTIYGVDTFVPLFVQVARGGTALSAGAVVTPLLFFWAFSASVAARTIVAFGFRNTARTGASLIVMGFAALIAAVQVEAAVGWITAACAVIGCGLGPCSMTQVLGIQHVASEHERGVATSLVPFCRSIGGALGVGALGALLAAGLTQRLGAAGAAVELVGAPGAEAVVVPAATRVALEASLVPVFVVLLVLALLNLAVTGWFPSAAATRPAAA